MQHKCRIVAIIYVSDLKLAIDLEHEVYMFLATRPLHDLIMQVQEVYTQKEKVNKND